MQGHRQLSLPTCFFLKESHKTLTFCLFFQLSHVLIFFFFLIFISSLKQIDMICYGKGRLPLVKGTESLGHFGPQWNCCAWVNSPLLQNKLGVCAGLLYGLPTGLLMTGTLFNLQALNPAGHVSIFLEWFFWLLAIWRWGILLPPCASLFRYISKSEMRSWSRRERGVCVCVCVCECLW